MLYLCSGLNSNIMCTINTKIGAKLLLDIDVLANEAYEVVEL